MSVLAIIPARSGSKGLKNKNIKSLAGHPLMYYSIRASIDSDVFDEVMVSTDSQQYADIAKECGASVPFLRSEEMSSDTATSWDMVEEVLDKYEEIGKHFDTICLLQPTSPLRSALDIQNAYRLYNDKKANAVVAVCQAEHPPMSLGTLDADGGLGHFVSREGIGRRQDYKSYYRINGAIYFVDVKSLRADHYIYKENSYAYIMDSDRSIDIDSEFDFRLAEFMLDEVAE